MRDHVGRQHACADDGRVHHDHTRIPPTTTTSTTSTHHVHHDHRRRRRPPPRRPPRSPIGPGRRSAGRGGRARRRCGHGAGPVATARARLLVAGGQRRLRPHHAAGGDGVPEVLRARDRRHARCRDGGDDVERSPNVRGPAPTPARWSRSTSRSSCCSSSIDGHTEWILNTSTGSEIAYDEPDKNSPGERQIGDSVTRNGLARRLPRASPRGGGRATSARSTVRSTSPAAKRCTVRTASPTIPPRTAACASACRRWTGSGPEHDAAATSPSGSTVRSPAYAPRRRVARRALETGAVAAYGRGSPMNRTRPTVADIRANKGKRQMTMVHIENLEEARACAAAGIDVLSIETPIWDAAMREAAGDMLRAGRVCSTAQLQTTDDYLRGAHDAMQHRRRLLLLRRQHRDRRAALRGGHSGRRPRRSDPVPPHVDRRFQGGRQDARHRQARVSSR